MQFPIFAIPVWTVTQVNRYLRDILESDELLQDIWISGEISNLSQPPSGHIYFTLKDRQSSLRCVIWRNTAMRLTSPLRDGQAIEAHGNISVYEPGGQYQLYVDAMRPAGEGELYQQFLRLKARLEAEGLFDPARKKPIPPYPRCIGVVTSPSGAALQDVLNTLRRRYPLAQVILAPTTVQGEEAPAGIVDALQALNTYVRPDVILLVRGGGSLEDLWAFNDEQVARAIAASETPIISGVGHEIDFTIADFVSDLRAPTPTAAAELATPDRQALTQEVNVLAQRLTQAVRRKLDYFTTHYHAQAKRLKGLSPLTRIRSQQQQVDELSQQAFQHLTYRLAHLNLRLQGLHHRLLALNPTAVLRRGYAILRRPDGEVIRSVKQVLPNTRLNALLQDGVLPLLANPSEVD